MLLMKMMMVMMMVVVVVGWFVAKDFDRENRKVPMHWTGRPSHFLSLSLSLALSLSHARALSHSPIFFLLVRCYCGIPDIVLLTFFPTHPLNFLVCGP